MNSKDYSMEERLNTYAETHLDLLMKSRLENSHRLELMKALECKKRYENLKEY